MPGGPCGPPGRRSYATGKGRQSMIRRIAADRRGVASVEFVLILPILLLILFLSVELSRAWFTMNLMTTAAREGVRAAVVSPPGQVVSVATARIDSVLGAGNWTGTITCTPSPCVTDSQVTANISVNFTNLFPVLLWMLPQPLVLQQTASMRYE